MDGCEEVRAQGFAESVVLDVQAIRLARMAGEEVAIAFSAARSSYDSQYQVPAKTSTHDSTSSRSRTGRTSLPFTLSRRSMVTT
jgi:hypothetical protein